MQRELALRGSICYLPHFVLVPRAETYARGAAGPYSMTEHEAYIALNMIPGVGPVRIRRWAEHVGSVEGILDAPETELLKVGGAGPEAVRKLVEGRRKVDPDAELQRAERLGVTVLTPALPEYPAPLRRIYDPPPVLYVRGELAALKRDAVAIVGTRRPSLYGQETARRFAFDLAHMGLTVVSGLALGVDAEAHRGALQANGMTVAVIGAALDKLAPVENRGLARSIVEGGGAVISEFPLGRGADRTTFPMRNRVVSGLSRGVLVIEAGPRSGTLITADQALEQGRSVMAVPGRIDSVASRGCHRLLKAGAALVESLDDVLEEISQLTGLKKVASADSGSETVARAVLTDDEQRILDAVGGGEVAIDALIRQTGIAAGSVGALLVGLELKRCIRMLPGRVVKAL